MCVDGGNVIARVWVVVHSVRGAISLTTEDALSLRSCLPRARPNRQTLKRQPAPLSTPRRTRHHDLHAEPLSSLRLNSCITKLANQTHDWDIASAANPRPYPAWLRLAILLRRRSASWSSSGYTAARHSLPQRQYQFSPSSCLLRYPPLLPTLGHSAPQHLLIPMLLFQSTPSKKLSKDMHQTCRAAPCWTFFSKTCGK
jgi:hypothetical protein